MIRIALVEDEERFRQILMYKCKQIYQTAGIPCKIDIFGKPSLLLYEFEEKKQYDIYLLDIELPEYNGIVLGEKIRLYQEDAYIIYITSHLEYSLEGYNVNAFQYISKFNYEERLEKTLKLIQIKLEKRKDKVFIIETPTRYERISIDSIICVYKERKNALFVIDGEEVIEYRETLKNIYSKLPQKDFIFVDRGYVVNILHIMKVKGNQIHLRNKTVLPISRGHVDYVKERIYAYWED